MKQTRKFKETCSHCGLVLHNVAALACRNDVCPADENGLVEIKQLLVDRAFCFVPGCTWMFMQVPPKSGSFTRYAASISTFSTGGIEEIAPFNDGAGVIGKEQFLDLNEKIGGVDIDANFIPRRTVGDRRAARHGYESGRFLSGSGGLAAMPIIDHRAYADFANGDPHMRFHSFSARARLVQMNGHANNHVMLVEDLRYGLFSTTSPLVREALQQMDRWLLNIAQDTSDTSRAIKVVQAKPADLVDSCVLPNGVRVREPQTYTGQGECNKAFPPHASPYIVAGMPVANNVVMCQRKAVQAADYKVTFTATEMERLRRIFPGGVCDYSKPGFEQRPLMDTWLSFGPAGTNGSEAK